MAEAIVPLAIQRISDLLIQEAVYLGGIREQVERLMAQLRRMRSFLEDANENHKQEQDQRLRNRVEEIRDLAYDAEDVIDTFILKVAHQGGFQGIIKKFSRPIHLHKIGVQVKAIQAKLEDISKSLPAYQITDEAEGSSSVSRTLQQQRLRRTYSHVEEVDVASLDGVTTDVLARLMTEEEQDRPHVVVSIVGMGGIGKTTLVQKVYNRIDVKRHFDCCAWAFVSQDCKPREVVHDVLIKVLSLSKEERKRIDKLKEDELIKRLFNALKEKRYLIVLDDIWRSRDWSSLKFAFPRGKKGSRILFTTRNKEVALLADPVNSPIELPLLTNDESWDLFKRKAFPGNMMESQARSQEFEAIGRKMVKKCGGLPLAIVVLGSFMATKRSRAQWEMVHRSIHAHLNKVQQQDNHYGAVNMILVLSYNDLPCYLKPCFMHLGHYPEDWEISKEQLIRLWIAEGFISPSLESEGMLMEDVAEQFLEELINRSLVQVGRRDYTGVRVKTCRIHDLLRDLCLVKAREEKFLEIIHPSIENHGGDSADVTLSKSMLRRIAIHPTKKYVRLKGEHPKLRSLSLFQVEKLIELHISKCRNFKLLRVLKVVKRDVDNWYVSSAIGNLHHLRYLRLECIGKSRIVLPPSIGKLKSLYTLHVQCYNGSIRIPNVVFKLERLRHILLLDDKYNFERGSTLFLPPKFTSKNIETLKYVKVENLIENCKALLSLTNIQNLGIIFERSEVVEPTLKALTELHRLGSLELIFEGGSVSNLKLEPLSQCHHLSELELFGKIEEDPHSSHQVLKFFPENIVKLVLHRSQLMQDPMALLEKLPHLRILALWEMSYKGTKLKCSADGFLQLDSLDLGGLSDLEEWEIEDGAMPRLRSLLLFQVLKLRKFPEGLMYLTALQEMRLRMMKRSLVERIEVTDNGREGDDFNKVSHIPSVQITDTMED